MQKHIGPACTRRGRPADGFHTKRTAEAWLDAVLEQARAGTLAGLVRVPFDQAADEWLRYVAKDRACKPSTLRDHHNNVRRHLLPAFGSFTSMRSRPR